VCVWGIKSVVVVFPSFCKDERAEQTEEKENFVRWKKNMKKNWHTLFFICYI